MIGHEERLRRWRLLLGRYAENRLPCEGFGQGDRDLDQMMASLYENEWGVFSSDTGLSREGSLDPSALSAINLMDKTRKLFPTAVFEKLQNRAIDKFGLDAILAKPEFLKKAGANKNLLKALISFRGKISSQNAALVRALIKSVIDDMLQKIKPLFDQALSGKKNRFLPGRQKSARNLDFQKTIKNNMKNRDPDSGQMYFRRIYFNSRLNRKKTKTVILLVDQSGSMLESLLFSAVIASILCGFPAFKVHLILFDTGIVDMTDLCHDPVEILLTAQLGGGTNIAQAMEYGASLIKSPKDTILITVSDFFEGASERSLISSTKQLASGGIKLLGLTALTDGSVPFYNHQLTARLTEAGMSIASLTPDKLAQWLSEEIN